MLSNSGFGGALLKLAESKNSQIALSSDFYVSNQCIYLNYPLNRIKKLL